VLPDGATCTIANSERRFSASIDNVLSWFQHAVERDRITNSLMLVTGHVKSKSWGVAAIANSLGESSVSLNFSLGGTGGGSITAFHSWQGYSPWMCNTGPRNQSQKSNQCIFIRGFRIMKRARLSPLRLVSEIKVTDLTDGRSTYPKVGWAGGPSADQTSSPAQESQVIGSSIVTVARGVDHRLTLNEAESGGYATVDLNDELVVEELPEREEVSINVILVKNHELT
jgi:hypothetical protein